MPLKAFGIKFKPHQLGPVAVYFGGLGFLYCGSMGRPDFLLFGTFTLGAGGILG
jgi:hypothetical protein